MSKRFKLHELYHMQNVLMDDIDIFTELAADLGRRVVNYGDEVQFDVDKVQLLVWLSNKERTDQVPEWIDDSFHLIFNVICDGYVFWCDVPENENGENYERDEVSF